MTIALPAAVERYLRADASADEDRFSTCFAADAEVRDEARTIEGLPAIKAWKRESRQKYQYVVDPLACTRQGDTVLLTARVAGNFPGSPIELTYAFVVQDDLITSLEIR